MTRRAGAMLALAGALGSGPAAAAEFLLQVTGTEATPFAATYMLTRDDGTVASSTVEGVSPASIRFQGQGLTVRLMARGAGPLHATITRDGKPVSQGMASGTSGRISLSAGDGVAGGGGGSGYGWGGSPR
ncbi:MAG: hypothetical protein ACOZDY_13805 [Pseudomonadota bacterium]